MRVVVIGQGYVGLPLAVCIASAGHHVVGVDIDSELVAQIAAGDSPIGDVGHSELSSVLATGRYSVAADFSSVASADVVLICVPTPLGSDDLPDLAAFESAMTAVAANIPADCLVVVESTVAPGTVRNLADGILSVMRPAGDYELVYSPERVDPGNAVYGVANTAKLVAGLRESGTVRAVEFYSSFVSTVVPVSSIEVVETAKLLENSFRLVNISFINEVAQYCDALGVDVNEVIAAASTKPYGFMPFYPSAGVGGHCIPIDPVYLAESARELGVVLTSIDTALSINDARPEYFVGVATGMLGGLSGRRILVVGVAYKAGVSDVRETPAASLIDGLRAGGAVVAWHDDLVSSWRGEEPVQLSSNFDLVIEVNPDSTCEVGLLGSVPVLKTRGGK